MALHRDIYWVGKQWAVTGHGIQACDQKQKGQFDIEASRLWENGVLEEVRALQWLNAEDFEKAVSVARKHYPEPPGRTSSPKKPVSPPNEKPLSVPKEKPVAPPKETSVAPPKELPKEKAFPPEPPKVVAREYRMGSDGLGARLVPVWRIRTRVSGRQEKQ